MDIRTATEHDIPLIVELLKKSLGEELMPKSTEYWQWKHVDNPFGKSPVILAFENDTLVGIRAFMRWQWKSAGQIFESVRAVDTATHPDYQGRGIFKKLTLELLDYCEREKWHFVFNTPNNNSKPGYLKMGWKEAGKLPISIPVVHPFSMALNMSRLKQSSIKMNDNNGQESYLLHSGLEELLKQNASRCKDQIITAHSVNSLLWRYKNVPVAKYFTRGLQTGEKLNVLLVYRLKSSKAGNELRVTDIFMDADTYKTEVRAMLKELVKFHEADYVTVSGLNSWLNGAGLYLRKLPVGPVVTVRNITFDAANTLQNFHGWSPSVGDLELF
jgi:N-acetylglutamate synthase-like GNAT family acetyltransferase